MQLYIKLYLIFLVFLILSFICCNTTMIYSKCNSVCPINHHRESYYPLSNMFCDCVYNNKACLNHNIENALTVEKVYDINSGIFGPCQITKCNEGYTLKNGTCVPIVNETCISSDPNAYLGKKSWSGSDWGRCNISKCKQNYTILLIFI